MEDRRRRQGGEGKDEEEMRRWEVKEVGEVMRRRRDKEKREEMRKGPCFFCYPLEMKCYHITEDVRSSLGFTLDHCTDLEERHKAHHDSSANTHNSCI